MSISSAPPLRASILTREYPPDVYGGAGVHVDFLVRELRRLIDVDVQCMGEPREGATAHTEQEERLAGANPALQVLSADLAVHRRWDRAATHPTRRDAPEGS